LQIGRHHTRLGIGGACTDPCRVIQAFRLTKQIERDRQAAARGRGMVMAGTLQRPGGAYVQRSSSGGLYEVIDVILDKGLVIDVFLRVSLVGIELLTVDARIVIASVDTYLRFAEAVNRLEITGTEQSEGLPQLMQ